MLAKGHLERAVSDVSTLRSQLTDADTSAAQQTAEHLEDEASAARSLTGDPVWGAAQYVPFFGTNLRAVREVAVVVDDVADGAVSPVAGVVGGLGVDSFAPKDGKVDLDPLVKAQPAVAQAAETLTKADRDAQAIDTSGTLSPVTSAVNQLRNAVQSASTQVDTANRVVQLAPAMLARDGERNYVLLFQNNAELRAGGGIPGAVALLKVQDGSIKLENQAAGSSFGPYEQPVLPLEADTASLYGDITGRYMQDVNLTPRFDVSAQLAREMWKQKFGQEVDGVLAMDPVTLSYMLRATGPVQLETGETLTSDNAVQLLLSDVYAKYSDPAVQDVFFASAASAVFDKVSTGGFDAKQFIGALTQGRRGAPPSVERVGGRAAAARRHSAGRRTPHRVASDPAVRRLPQRRHGRQDGLLPRQDRVGRIVGLPAGRSSDVRGRGDLKNTAPADAATSLPRYVTGGGDFGTEPGKIKTLVAVYAPENAIYLGSTQDGKQVGVQTATDGGHPVTQLQTLLAPGESTTFRVAYLGDAKFANAGVEAISTPGVKQGKVEPLQFECKDPIPAG